MSPAYAADGLGVYCATDQDRDLAAVVLINLPDLAQTVIAEPAAEVEELAVSADGRYQAWAENVDGAHALQALALDHHLHCVVPAAWSSPADLVLPALAQPGRAVGLWRHPTRTTDVWIWDLRPTPSPN
jgi:hypothetical protein